MEVTFHFSGVWQVNVASLNSCEQLAKHTSALECLMSLNLKLEFFVIVQDLWNWTKQNVLRQLAFLSVFSVKFVFFIQCAAFFSWVDTLMEQIQQSFYFLDLLLSLGTADQMRLPPKKEPRGRRLKPGLDPGPTSPRLASHMWSVRPAQNIGEHLYFYTQV